MSERFRDSSMGYKFLIENLIPIFEKLSMVEAETKTQRLAMQSLGDLHQKPVHEIQALLEKLQSIDKFNLDILKQAKSESEAIVPKIYEHEPAPAAGADVDKINRAFAGVLNDWTDFEKQLSSKLKEILGAFQKEQDECIKNSTQVRI